MRVMTTSRAMKVVWMAALLVLAMPASAAAQWHVTPFVGGNFGGATGQSLTLGDEGETKPWTVGVTGGWMKGWIGVDVDLAHAPRFFDNDGGFISDSGLMTAMVNARVAIPFGGMGEGVQPFASAGVGAIRPKVGEPGGFAEARDTKFGWNAGLGLVGYFTEHVGLGGDVRYFRAMEDQDATNPFGIDFDGFDFWRASVGLSFKW